MYDYLKGVLTDKRKNSSNKNSFYYHGINYSYDKNSNSNISKNIKRNKSNQTIMH